MKRVYEVSLKEFAIKDGLALAQKGTTELGRTNALELMQILMIFQDISPIQHFEGEPTITICTRSGAKYLVRTDLHKLLLYDTRQMQAPAQVLEAASILLEMEDNAAALRNRINANLTKAAQAPQAKEAPKPAAPAPTETKQTKSQRTQLLAFVAAFVLLLVVFSIAYTSQEDKGPVFEPLEQESLPPILLKIVGSYSSGPRADDYELALLISGEVRMMQPGGNPPKLLKANYTVGMLDGKLCLRAPGFDPIYPENNTLKVGELLFKRQ